jgi:predicted NACHT family NTPase
MAQQLRERNYILCLLGQDNFAFVHRTLLEYFCASALVRQSLRAESSVEFLKHEVFGPHWRDEVWHEVLRLIAGMDDQAPVERVAEVIDFLLLEKDEGYEFHNIFLAANCCLEVRNPRVLGLTRTRVTDALLLVVRLDFPDFYNDFENKAIRRHEIRAKAVRLLANPQLFDTAYSWLKDQAAKDDSWSVRQAAVQELARGWKDNPDTLPWLKERAAKDDFYSVREAAVQELARGWKDDPDTLSILKDRAEKDDFYSVRQAAVQELARGWKDDQETLPILKARATQDDSGSVRKAAVQELARGWKDDPETLPILKARATQDDSGSVRKAAVQELARGWKDHPDTLPLLKDRAVNDPSPAAELEKWRGGVRDAAIEAIFRGWPDDPGTLLLLRERAENDPTPWLREKAKRLADEIEARG